MDLALDFKMAIRIDAPPERVWRSLTTGVGEWFTNPDPANPLHMTLEPRVGGRFYRDLSATLGEGAGHLWGHVQVFKPPMLLEIIGPMAVSDAQLTHIAFRLTPADAGTEVVLAHRAIGMFPRPEGVKTGWNLQMQGLKAHAER